MIFAYFLGMCSYLAVSKNVKTAMGLGVAVTFVLVITLSGSITCSKITYSKPERFRGWATRSRRSTSVF